MDLYDIDDETTCVIAPKTSSSPQYNSFQCRYTLRLVSQHRTESYKWVPFLPFSVRLIEIFHADNWFAGGNEPVPDSGLINSAGRFNGGPDVPLTRINVTQGKRYRLRFVSLSANGFFNVSIQNHRMTIIEADGNSLFFVYWVLINNMLGISTVPYVVDSINILPAQRYSVVVSDI